MTAIGIFAVLGAGSIAAVHASIIGDFGIGYQAGKNQIGIVDIPKMIHVLVVIVYPTVQDTLLDMTPNGERFNKHSHSTSIVRRGGS